jgi:hypothetical protein
LHWFEGKTIVEGKGIIIRGLVSELTLTILLLEWRRKAICLLLLIGIETIIAALHVVRRA